MQVVLYTLMCPHDLPQTFRVGGIQAADEVTGFLGSAVLAFAEGYDSNNAGDIRPMSMVFRQPPNV